MGQNKVCLCGRTSLVELCALLITLVVGLTLTKTHIFQFKVINPGKVRMYEKDYYNQQVGL